jgi:hypothetical protein
MADSGERSEADAMRRYVEALLRESRRLREQSDKLMKQAAELKDQSQKRDEKPERESH